MLTLTNRVFQQAVNHRVFGDRVGDWVVAGVGGQPTLCAELTAVSCIKILNAHHDSIEAGFLSGLEPSIIRHYLVLAVMTALLIVVHPTHDRIRQ